MERSHQTPRRRFIATGNPGSDIFGWFLRAFRRHWEWNRLVVAKLREAVAERQTT
jgi:hypothetical protein